MKIISIFIFAFLLISMLFALNSFAQDTSQWNLPDGAIARLGKGSIVDVAYSPDGTHFAVAGSIGIWLYDTQTYKETDLLTGDRMEISKIAFSPDGKTLASASWDDTIRLWDTETNMPRQTLSDGHNAIRRALELGVNYVDTGPNYGNSEEVVGEALDGVLQPHYLSTKIGGRPQSFDPKDKQLLRQSVEESLRLLKRDKIDILMVHEPDRPGQYDWWTSHETFDGPVCELLAELKAEGIVRFTGLGGTTAHQLPAIMATGVYDVVLAAQNYSLLWREAAISIFPEAKRQNMGIVIGAPLQQGALSRRHAEVETGAWWLSRPRQEQFKVLYQFLDEIELSLPEAGIRMVISNPDISTVLVGARSVEEVEQNVRAVEAGPLPSEVLERLQKIADMVPFRPFEEPHSLAFGREYSGPGPAR